MFEEENDLLKLSYLVVSRCIWIKSSVLFLHTEVRDDKNVRLDWLEKFVVCWSLKSYHLSFRLHWTDLGGLLLSLSFCPSSHLWTCYLVCQSVRSGRIPTPSLRRNPFLHEWPEQYIMTYYRAYRKNEVTNHHWLHVSFNLLDIHYDPVDPCSVDVFRRRECRSRRFVFQRRRRDILRSTLRSASDK